MPNVMDAYIRVSVVGGKGGDRFQPPGAQREAIERWAEYEGVTVGEWHEDYDVSGGKDPNERQGLKACLERLKAGDTQGVIVYKLDRLSRSVIHGLTLVEKITTPRDQGGYGGAVVSTAEKIDTATSNGRLMLRMLFVIAEWYREAADESLAAVQARATGERRFPGKPPYGTVRNGSNKTELEPHAAAVVKRIFEERAAGKGFKSIATDLTRGGIDTPTAARKRMAGNCDGPGIWSASTVQSILKSEAALGTFVGPRGVRVEGAWDPMVTRSLWDAANAVTGKRDAERRHHDRLVAGIARCAHCRRVLKRTTNQANHVSYTCTNRGCPKRSSIGAAVLDEFVTAVLDERLARLRLEPNERTDDQYNTLREAAEDAAAELEWWATDTEMRRAIGDEVYRAGLMKRARKRDDAQEALTAHVRRSRSGVELPGDRDVTLAEFDWETRRRVADAYLHAAFIRPAFRRGPISRGDVAERVRFVWSDDPNPPTLPGPAQPTVTPYEW